MAKAPALLKSLAVTLSVTEAVRVEDCIELSLCKAVLEILADVVLAWLAETLAEGLRAELSDTANEGVAVYVAADKELAGVALSIWLSLVAVVVEE